MLFVNANQWNPSARGRGGVGRWFACGLAALLVLLCATRAAAAPPKVYGVSDGQTVTGPVVIWAEAQRISHWMSIRLQGPGTRLETRTGGSRVHLVESGSTGTPLAWDASQAEPGNYTLQAISFVRNIPVARETVRFRVERPKDVTTAEEAADPLPIVPEAEGGEEEPRSTDDRRDESLPRARFGEAFPDTLVQSVAEDRRIVLDGVMPEGGDVLVLAWDLDRNRMVDAAVHEIDRAPWAISGDHLAELPDGEVELQLHVRHGKEFVQTDKKRVRVRAATASPGRLPSVGFANDAPRAWTLGDQGSLRLDVDGNLPGNADLLVIAWSIGRGALVESFATTLTQPPFVVPASALNRLPDGVVEVQVLTRVGGQVKRKAVHTMRVTDPSAPNTGGNGAGDEAPNTGDDNDRPDVAPDPREPNGDDPPPANENPDGDGRNPNAPPAPTTVSFRADTPANYTRGSDAAIRVEVDGSLPDAGDVLMLAWHKQEGRMIDAFAHELRGGERRVSNGMLDKIPAGDVEIQAHLRMSSQAVAVTKRDLQVQVPGVPQPELEQPDTPAPVAPGSGFTAYPLAPGARAVYVSATGSDANSGLSPDAPLKSPRRGMDMLRDGYPDQLLFKAGDVFSGGLGVFHKSGRSPNEKMVVGVYGSGARPMFKTGDGNFMVVHDTVRNVAFVGLHAYSNRRDPSSPDYRSNDVPYLVTGVAWYGNASHVAFEDVRVEWYKDNFVFQASSPGGINNVRLYRVISNNSWCPHSHGHSQGLFTKAVSDFEVIESTFDHNGWRPGNWGDRTKFNHNMYIQKDSRRVHIRRTIVTRGCHNGIQLRGGGTIEDNLFHENAFAALVATAPSVMRRNVVLESIDLRDDYRLGYALQVLPCVDAKVEDNLIAHKKGTAGWLAGIEIAYRDDIIDPPSSYNVELRRNIIVDWPLKSGRRSIQATTGSANIRVDQGNVLDRASGGPGDPPFVDPDRDLSRYAQHIGVGNDDGFMRAAVNRARGAWEDKFAAAGAIRWIRQGFEYLPYD